TVAVSGVGSVTTWGSGGYSFRLSPGTYTVTASGGGLASPVTRTVTVGSQNYRLNFLPASGPQVQVMDGSQAVGSGRTVAMSTLVGSPVTHTFTVTNAGSQTLTLGSLSAMPAGFTLTSPMGASSLAPGASTTFAIRLDAAAAGTYGGTVSFATNDPANNP